MNTNKKVKCPICETFNNKEETIYHNCFSKCMDKRTFKKILSSGSYYHIANNNFLVQQGNTYTGVYLVVYLSPKNQITVYENDKIINNNHCNSNKNNNYERNNIDTIIIIVMIII